MIDFLLLMKQELIITVIIFTLLLLKIGTEMSNTAILNLANGLLLFNLAAGFMGNQAGMLFDGMFFTNPLIVLQKNILSLGTLIVSLQSSSWLKKHEHVPEFYILLLSNLLGMFFMISTGNLLMFYVGLELSSIPLAAMANFDLGKRKSSEAAMKFIVSSVFCIGLIIVWYFVGIWRNRHTYF
ncbi:hypothetical protein [Niastella sp. OAS944]|uniref:hypothetical protein n=1 Tax=Niastella sp. OAS944 TaxID=2664089 RepID=UPI003484B68D